MGKKDKLMDAIQQILEIYPDLDIVMMDDMENPTKFMMTTAEAAIAEGQLDEETIEALRIEGSDGFENVNDLPQLDWDDDDDENGGGYLQ